MHDLATLRCTMPLVSLLNGDRFPLCQPSFLKDPLVAVAAAVRPRRFDMAFVAHDPEGVSPVMHCPARRVRDSARHQYR